MISLTLLTHYSLKTFLSEILVILGASQIAHKRVKTLIKWKEDSCLDEKEAMYLLYKECGISDLKSLL